MLITSKHRLVERSIYASRIKELLDNPSRGKIRLRDEFTVGQPSNCYGTLLYILGFVEKPEFVKQENFEKLLGRYFNRGKNIDGIVIFRGRYWMQHSGLYIGQTHKQNVIFHQPNTGEPYTAERIIDYRDKYPAAGRQEYYSLKK
jgi:hypothetical protein